MANKKTLRAFSLAMLALFNAIGCQAAFVATADSFQTGNEAANALDGSTSTIWHSKYSPTTDALPHTFTIDMQTTQYVSAVTYLPRQDGNSNGNIGEHTIALSTDGTTWSSPVAFGTYWDEKRAKVSAFQPKSARYVRLTAITEAGGRGQWTSAAEISLTTSTTTATVAPASQGNFDFTIDFPTIAVAAAVVPQTGKVLAWSSYEPHNFGGGSGRTVTTTYDPATKKVTQRTVANTAHDMFCPGVSIDFQGRIIVTGGNDAAKTSIYNGATDAWTAGPLMKISRGYQAQATLSNGNTFVIGGSWSGGQGGKNGELYNPSTNTYTLLSGCPVAPMLTADSAGVYRADNHGWLFGWKSGSVFQAGPSKKMNWYGTTGTGSTTPAGTRAADPDSMCGNAVMYDAVAGKILTLGGSPNYQDSTATTNAHIITIGNPGTTATVAKVASFSQARAFANAIVLPDGKVLVAGGQSYAVPFTDTNAAMNPELYDPATNTWTVLATQNVARTYHSVVLLMPDATVFIGGGGLCTDCATNHFDAQIYSPPYLFTSSGARATQPKINTVSATTVRVGTSITVTTDSTVTKFSLIRYGSATHTVDTDQRRIGYTANGTSNTLTLPSDSGVALPGYWMLFAVNAAGVPSIAKTILVTL